MADTITRSFRRFRNIAACFGGELIASSSKLEFTIMTNGEGLIERLNRRHTCRMGEEVTVHHLINPDGPEAATALSEQAKRIEVLDTLQQLADLATRVSLQIEREERDDGEERYVVKGVPCGFPVAKFGDWNDANLFVQAAALKSGA
jgi:hypothetical protein